MKKDRCPKCGNKKIEPNSEDFKEWYCPQCYNVFSFEEDDKSKNKQKENRYDNTNRN